MPTWLNLQDPTVRTIVALAVGLIALALLGHFWQRWRDARIAARRRQELRRTYGEVQVQQQEIQRLAGQIIATSSRAGITGFAIVRQIEAVFTDGHRSPAEAVDMLKAMAARKGANALINLTSQRLPSGKSVASGDAVIVRPLPSSRPPPATSPPAKT